MKRIDHDLIKKALIESAVVIEGLVIKPEEVLSTTGLTEILTGIVLALREYDIDWEDIHPRKFKVFRGGKDNRSLSDIRGDKI